MNTDRRSFLRLMPGMAAIPIIPAISDSVAALPKSWVDVAKTPDTAKIRDDFPALHQSINGFPLVYLDSAATAQRPRAVIEATSSFYAYQNANPSASLHTLARRSADLYESARRSVARFIHAASPEEIVWTRGTTEAINLVASSWGNAHLRPEDEILLTEAEHYSNLLPWRLVAERTGARLRFLEVDDGGNLRLERLDDLLSRRSRIVAFSHVSNVLGRINPAAEICERAHRAGALVLIDAAQSAPHIPLDVQGLGCDFLALSGHKIMGPMGIGVLWARADLLDALPPYQSGSNMAHEIASLETAPQFAARSHKFEAGTPNAAGAIGLAAAVEYLESLGRVELWKREQELTAYALESLLRVPGLRILGPTNAADRVSVFSFVSQDLSRLELVRALDAHGIAIRAGDLAALPLLKRFGVSAAARASCYIYTQRSDIDALVTVLAGLTRHPASTPRVDKRFLSTSLRQSTV